MVCLFLISFLYIAAVDRSSIFLVLIAVILIYLWSLGVRVLYLVFSCIFILAVFKSGLIESSPDSLLYHFDFSFNQSNSITFRPIPSGVSFLFITVIVLMVTVEDRSNFFNVSATAIFFPHILSGPILHKAIEVKEEPLYKCFPNFCMVFGGGLLLLESSNNIKNYFDLIGTTDGASSYVRAWVFYLYLLANFFGYSLIATAYSRLFGIEIPINFNAPSLSNSPSDFWLRWHRSLSLVFRNIMFKKLLSVRSPRVVAVFAVMILSGVWHGWGINYLIWGALHGLIIVLYPKKLPIVVNYAFMLIFFPMTWISFYTTDITTIMEQYRGVFQGHDNLPYPGLKSMASMFFMLALSFVPYSRLMKLAQIQVSLHATEPYAIHHCDEARLSAQALSVIAAGVLLALCYSYGIGLSSGFLYQRF